MKCRLEVVPMMFVKMSQNKNRNLKLEAKAATVAYDTLGNLRFESKHNFLRLTVSVPYTRYTFYT